MRRGRRRGSRRARGASPAGGEEVAEDGAGGEELRPGGDAAFAVPAGDRVAGEELAWEREEVLDVRGRGGEGADRDRAERAVAGGEREGAGGAASDLEALRPDVVVGHAVAECVEDEAKGDRLWPRASERAAGGARGDVERDDHRAARWGVCSRPGAGWPFSILRRSMSSEASPRLSGNSSPRRSQSAAASA